MKLQLQNQTLDFSKRPHVMGILNVTPDSFSDGGKFVTLDTTLRHVSEMVQAGVDIIDVGGESSRPFAEPVTLEEELQRVIPVIKSIRSQFQVPISIDTTKAAVARAAIEAGADIINDISALRFDPEMATLANQSRVPVIIMHMQGSPGDMQVNPTYKDVIAETYLFFQERINWLVEKGIDRNQIVIDPGIGFGKTLGHNLSILNHVEDYCSLGCAVLVGHSRKAFIGKILNTDVGDRDIATAALSGLLSTRNVAILRVHNVQATLEAIKICQAVIDA